MRIRDLLDISRRLAPAAVAASLVLLGATAAGSEENVSFGVTDFPPWFVVEGEDIAGIVPDTIRPIFEELGVPLDLQVRPIARLRSEVESGDLDCRAMSKGPKSGEIYHFGAEPLYRLAYSVFARREDGARITIPDRLEELGSLDLRWGLVHGLTYTPDLLTHLPDAGTILRSYRNEDNLQHLLQDRLDVVLAEPLTFVHLAENEGVADRIVLLELSLITKDYFLGCHGSPELAALPARVDERLRSLRAGSGWEEILSRYLGADRRDLYLRLSGGPSRP